MTGTLNGETFAQFASELLAPISPTYWTVAMIAIGAADGDANSSAGGVTVSAVAAPILRSGLVGD